MGVTICMRVEGMYQRLVICEYGEYAEVSPFQEVTEVSNGKLNSQKLSVKGVVMCLCRCHLFGKERDRTSLTINILLQNSSSDASVMRQVEASRLGIERESSISFLGCIKRNQG